MGSSCLPVRRLLRVPLGAHQGHLLAHQREQAAAADAVQGRLALALVRDHRGDPYLVNGLTVHQRSDDRTAEAPCTLQDAARRQPRPGYGHALAREQHGPLEGVEGKREDASH